MRFPNVRMDDPRVAPVLDRFLTLYKMGGVKALPDPDGDDRGDRSLWHTRLSRWEEFQGFKAKSIGYNPYLCTCGVCKVIMREAGVKDDG